MSVPGPQRAVAIFEAAKGVLVLAAGLGLLELIHHDFQSAAGDLVAHLHLDPAKRYPRIFLQLASHSSKPRMIWLALGAGLYALLRLIEAYGLWHGRRWASWFAAISGGIYIPYELYELAARPNALAAGALLVNLLVVIVMVRAVLAARRVAAG
jgi:uncharacterized membrane protein (DUF2068 family)